MTTTILRPQVPTPVLPADAETPTIDMPTTSTEFGDDLRRIQTEEQARVDREAQENLARLRELARFD